MRIAFIVSEFPALSETFILNQITGLIDRGHEVDIYADRLGEAVKVHPDVEKYDLLRCTYCFARPSNRWQRFFTAIKLLLGNFLHNPTATLQSLNFLKYGKPATSLQLLFASTPLIRKPSTYDIIHCHFGPNGLRAQLLCDIGVLRGKLLTTFHGFDISSYVRKYGDRVYDPLFCKTDLLLPISHRMKQQLIKMGCDEAKIKVHHMGINVEQFSFTPRQLQGDRPVHILSIARLVEKKGIEYGIRAVAKVAKTIPNLKYFIVGDGPLRQSLESLIQDLNASDKIQLLGWQQQQEISRIIKQSDLLLAPSVTSKTGDQEGIPVVLMEAMAEGLPIISTDHSGIPELVEDGVSGFLVPERDVDALAAKLGYLIEHPKLWAEMGLAGRAHVQQEYNIDRLNDQLVAIYEELQHPGIRSKVMPTALLQQQ